MKVQISEIHSINNVEVKLKAGQYFIPDKKYVYILISGEVTGIKHNDYIYTWSIPEFAPLGFLEILSPMIDFLYVCETSVILRRIEKQKYYASNNINNSKVEMVMSIVAQLFSVVLNEQTKSANNSGYTIIVSMLYRYLHMYENQDDFNENIAAFITGRTRLSKSYVFEILASLKKGGYIMMEKGKLITILKKIPSGY
ncbi:MAG TPA: helix-turn-helix domain-containing protein [Scandinavium sp.]